MIHSPLQFQNVSKNKVQHFYLSMYTASVKYLWSWNNQWNNNIITSFYYPTNNFNSQLKVPLHKKLISENYFHKKK